MTNTDMANDLNGLLKGEISACETYRQALEKVEEPGVRTVLQKNHECHSKRVPVLQAEVTKAGAEPAKDSGVWGAVAKFMEGGSKVFGDKASISTLEEGEDKGLGDYKKFVEKHGSTCSAISELHSKQEGTHAACRDLKHSMA